MQDDRKRWKPVQNFAFGGIANPGQRPFLRGTDRQYLQQRQDELDEFERQRVAYNTALESWQQQQYNPYVEAANAYNQAAQEYNTQVYEPYAQQYAQYEQALNAWNQGPRTTDYAGPSEPQLGSTFDMAQPVAPDPFTLQAPGLPFDEAQVAAYQQQAAQRARRDAADRAVAIDVVSDPSRFNFGSMSITNRFMAKGGLVSNSQRDLSELGGAGRSPIVSPSGMVVTPSYDQGPRSEAQAMLRKLGGPVQRFASGGSAQPQAYTTQDIVNAYNQSVGSGAATEAQFVDYARSLGISDNALLAARDQVLGVSAQNDSGLTPGDIGYVAPSVTAGDSYEVNHPGLTPGDIGYVAPGQYLGGDPTEPSNFAPAAPVPAPVTAAPTTPTAQVTAAPVTVAPTTPTAPTAPVTAAQTPTAPVTAAQTPAAPVTAAPTPGPAPTPAPAPAPVAVQASTANVYSAPAAVLTPAIATSLMQRSMTTGVPTSEFNKYGGYDAVKAVYDQANGTYSLSDIPKDLLSQYANTVANTGVGNLSVLKETGLSLTPQAIANMVKNGIDPSIIAQFSQPKNPIIAQPKIPGLLTIAPNWSSLPGYQAGTQTGVTSYGGIKPLDMTAFFNSMPSASWNRAPGTTAPATPTTSTGSSGQTGQTTTSSGIPIVSPAIPAPGAIGTAGSLVSAPGIGAYGPIGTAVEQLPSGTPVSSQAVPYQPLQTYSGPTAGQRISANPNLSPGVIAPNNLGYMVDRLGNRIFSPAMVPGFAKGGEASIEALTALANASNMADEEEGPKVEDYVGQARQMLDQVTPQKRATAAMPRGPGPSRGGAESPKEMDMVTESLATLKDYKPKGQKSAKAQLRELARQYALKQRAATEESRGLSKNTFGAPTLEKPTLVRESLAVKRFEKGGEAKKDEGTRTPEVTGANRLLDFIAQRVSPEGFPTALRTLLETAQGNKTLITEANFSPEELSFIRDIVQFKGGKEGSIQYKDYQNFLQKMEERGDSVNQRTPSVFSIFEPYGNVQTTLGRFSYSQDPEGNLVVNDTYDFNQIHPVGATQESTTGDYGAMGPYSWIRNYAGEKIPPGHGRQIKVNLGPVKRADGSPEEGEIVDPEALLARSGENLPPPRISNEEFIREAIYGLQDVPAVMAGAPMDISTMLMRPFVNVPEKQWLGSDWIKEKLTNAGIRAPDTKEERLQGPRQMAELLGSMVNPAGVTRGVVRGTQLAGQGIKSGGMEALKQLDRAVMGDTGPLAKVVSGAAKPMYAARPEGSSLVIRRDQSRDWVGQLLDDGVRDARDQLANMIHSTDRAALMENFWNSKAANYFAKQFGTESDPVYRGIRDQTIKSPILGKDFPDYVLDQLPVGKTRVNAETGESRFFPKYPAAYDAMRKRYDDLTQIRGAVPVRDPASVMSPDFTYSTSRQGDEAMEALRNQEIDKMIAQGTPVSQATPMLEFLTRSVKVPETTLGPYNAKSILTDYEAATGTRLGDPNFQGVPQPNVLPQNLRTAFDKGEIMYGTGGPNAPLRQLFNPRSINEYLATLPERELKNLRFEDAVKGGAKVSAKRLERETLDADIRAGKRVPDKFFSEGVSAPLVQFQEGPLAGFSWKRIEKADATVPEGAYVGHSVGGYAQGGAYGPEKHRQFNEGLMRVYTLRDNRNRPVNTIEVSMENNGPVVTQIKGNGRATGNTAPEKYDQAVMQFLQDYLKPVRIRESDNYLTPLLQSYKEALRSTPSQP